MAYQKQAASCYRHKHNALNARLYITVKKKLISETSFNTFLRCAVNLFCLFSLVIFLFDLFLSLLLVLLGCNVRLNEKLSK